MDDEPKQSKDEENEKMSGNYQINREIEDNKNESEVQADFGVCNIDEQGQEIKSDWFLNAEKNHEELQKKLDEAKRHLDDFKKKDVETMTRVAKQEVEIDELKYNLEFFKSEHKTVQSKLEKLRTSVEHSSWKKEIEKQNQALKEWGNHCELQEKQFHTQLRSVEGALSTANKELRRCKTDKEKLQLERNELEKSREELLTRLSKIAGSRLTQNNPAITDLSDENRGTKLAEQFNELYDTEWTDSLEELVDKGLSEQEAICVIYTLVKTAFTFCSNIAESYKTRILESPSCLPVLAVTSERSNIQVNTEIELSGEIKSQLEDIRKTLAPLFCKSIEEIYTSMLTNILPESIKASKCQPKDVSDFGITGGEMEVEHSAAYQYQLKSKDQNTEADMLENNQNHTKHKNTMNNGPITTGSGIVEENILLQQTKEKVREQNRGENVGDFQSSGTLTKRIDGGSVQGQTASGQYISDEEQIKYQPNANNVIEHEVSEKKEDNEDTFSDKRLFNEDRHHCPEHIGNDDQIESQTIEMKAVGTTGDSKGSADNGPISSDTTQVREDAQVSPNINKSVDGSMDNRDKIEEDSKVKIQTAQTRIDENEVDTSKEELKVPETDKEDKIRPYENDEIKVNCTDNGDKETSDKVHVKIEDADNYGKTTDVNKEKTEIADTENKDNKLVSNNEDKLDDKENQDERSTDTGNEDMKTPDTGNEDKKEDIDIEDVASADTNEEKEKTVYSEKEAKSADRVKEKNAADKDMEGEKSAHANNEGKFRADTDQEDGKAADKDNNDEYIPKTDYKDTKIVGKNIENKDAAHTGNEDKKADVDIEDVTSADINEEQDKAAGNEKEETNSADTEKKEKAEDKDMEGEKSADANNEGNIISDTDKEDGKAADRVYKDERLPKRDYKDTKTVGTNIENKEAANTVKKDTEAIATDEEVENIDNKDTETKDKGNEETKAADTDNEAPNVANAYNVSEIADDTDTETKKSADLHNENKITPDINNENKKEADAIEDTIEAKESEPVMGNAQTDSGKNESETPMLESGDFVNEDPGTVITETSDQFDLTLYEKTTVFASKCAKLCWHMRIKDPPLTILYDCNKGADFDTNVFKHYTRTGNKVGCIVWPALYLYENGPLLAKGVAQPL